MSKRVRSAKGEIVDFDILTIKAQLAGRPQMIDVQQRREFVDSRESGKSTNEAIEAALEIKIEPEALVAKSPQEDDFLIDPTKPLKKSR
jgi:hypothetical protein